MLTTKPTILGPGTNDLRKNRNGNGTKHEVLQLEFQDKKMDFFAFPLKQTPFTLDEIFIQQFADKQPQWGPLGYVTYKRTYSRIKEDGTQEEFWETIRRVVQGCFRIQQRHCQMLHLPWIPSKAQRWAQRMYRMMWEFKFLPPGRGLWIMGTPYIERAGGAALCNCAFVSTDQLDVSFSAPFTFLMDMSMLGVGVGSDTRGVGLVTIQKPAIDHTEIHVIEDRREGWVKAYRRLLEAYVGNDTLPHAWDYSQLRGSGMPLKGFGGRSAGPDPLRQLLEIDVPSVLDSLIGKPITISAITDIHNYAGKCVVSGGLRRSAEIMFGEADDVEFAELKDPDLHPFELDDRRWVSNNSIFAKVGMDYTAVVERLGKNGEPGLMWLENARRYGRMLDAPDDADLRVMGTNPCGEQPLESFELCCLVETFPCNHETYEEYEATCKMAYLYGKTVTLIPTHDPRVNQVQMRNRRIGTSQSGVVRSFGKHGRREHFNWCGRAYKYLRRLDRQYSLEWLCVPMSKRITTVKPSGTVSLLPGVPPGVHYPHAEFYIRRIRISKNHVVLLDALAKAGYFIEPDVVAPRTMVVEFPVHEEHFVKAESDVTIWEQMENVAGMQKWWSDNSVSVTIKFDPKTELPDIKNALECFEDRLKTISFLPKGGSHRYKQPPYEAITQQEYEARASQLKPLVIGDGKTHDQLDKYCDSDACTIT